jgi:hypothetical protein
LLAPPDDVIDLLSVLVMLTLACAITGVFGVVPVHAGAVPVHARSPPPLTVAEFVAVVAVAATLTGTVITIGLVAGLAMVQPVKLPPVAGQLAMTLPPMLGRPLNVMPTGSVSVKLIGAVVGPSVTLIVMV